jgi:hypothetical protein
VLPPAIADEHVRRNYTSQPAKSEKAHALVA